MGCQELGIVLKHLVDYLATLLVQLHQLWADVLVDLHPVQVLQRFLVFQESLAIYRAFIIHLGKATESAALEIKSKTMVLFVYYLSHVFHDDEVDRRKLLGLYSVQTKDFGDQRLIIIDFEVVYEVLEHTQQHFLLRPPDGLDNEFLVIGVEEEGTTHALALPSLEDAAPVLGEIKGLLDVVGTDAGETHDLQELGAAVRREVSIYLEKNRFLG